MLHSECRGRHACRGPVIIVSEQSGKGNIPMRYDCAVMVWLILPVRVPSPPMCIATVLLQTWDERRHWGLFIVVVVATVVDSGRAQNPI